MPSRLGWICALTLARAPLVAQQLGPIERARIAAALWSEARYNAPALDRIRSDWDSAFSAMLGTAPERQSDLVFYRRLQRCVALLRDGQAAVVPPATVASRWGRPPLVLRSVERRPFLVDYSENDELRVARPERNAEILAVQGIPAERWIRDSVLPEIAGATDDGRWELAVSHMLDGTRGTALHLQLRLPSGEERGASVTRSLSLTERWPLAPPPIQIDTLPDGMIWVRLTSFADPDVARRFDRALPTFDGIPGMILDLRDHGGVGGGAETGYRILGRLVSRALVTSRWRTPQYRPAFRDQDWRDSSRGWFRAPPDTLPPRTDLPLFTGPVAVLASARTGGAAEAMLVAFRQARRGPIVGQPSAGDPGQVGEFRLGKDWRLRLTVTLDAFEDGTEIQGAGVAPDIFVSEKVSDLLVGRDATLDRARDYITGMVPRP
jgi:hypothetical protein